MKNFVGPLVALVASFALALHGCGGDPATDDGSASISGLVVGSSVGVKSAITGTQLIVGQTATVVALTDVAGGCGLAKSNVNLKNAGELGFALWTNNGSGVISPVSAPGTYTLDDPSDANFPTSGRVGYGVAVRSDASCKDTDDFIASGTVTVTAVDSGGGLTGTFDATTKAGAHLTGSFRAPFCSYPASDGGAGACN
jgi:hypothetical protein